MSENRASGVNNPHSIQELGEFFSYKRRSTQPTFFDPPLTSLKDLRAIDHRTFLLLNVAGQLSSAFNNGTPYSYVSASLIGGMGALAHAHHHGVYRAVHDLDFLVTQQDLDVIRYQFIENRQVMKMYPGGLSRISPYLFLARASPQLAVNLAISHDPILYISNLIEVYFYVYSTYENGAFLKDGTHTPIQLTTSSLPIQPVRLTILGIPIMAAPQEVMLTMKELHSKTDEVGKVDHRLLKENSS